MLNNVFFISESNDKIGFLARTIWRVIKKLSFEEGISDSINGTINRHICEKWMVLKSPISLLLNSYYLNKNISLDNFETYLLDLIKAGENTFDIDDLCIHQFKSKFFRGTMRNYFENQFDELIKHSQKNKNTFPELNSIMNKCISLKEWQMKRLNEHITKNN